MSEQPFEYVYEVPINKLLKPQEEITVNFNGIEAGIAEKDRNDFHLRLTGEVDLYPMWRNEGNFPRLYELIDDALTNEVVHHSAWSLEVKAPVKSDASFSESDAYNTYPLSAWLKVTAGRENTRPFYSFRHMQGALNFSIWYKKEDIRLFDEGNISFNAEIYYKESAKYPEEIDRKPDEIFRIDISEGCSEWQKAEIRFDTRKEIDFILVHFNAVNFSGRLWLEDPFLGEDPEFNLLPPFAPANPFIMGFNWLGLNFSRKEWPEFDISLNGTPVFKGGLFQRIYRWPVSQLEIPKQLIVPGENKVIIKYISCYREPIPYRLKKAEILKTASGLINIVSCPEIVSEGNVFPVLVSTERDNTAIRVTSGNSDMIPLKAEYIFEKAGLHAVSLKALKAGPGAEITIELINKAGRETGRTAIVERVVRRQEDGVLTGTGDAVYIGQNMNEMEYFLSWFLHHNIGNAIVFRPVYRWGGSRTLNRGVWKHISRLCGEMHIHYANMIDGRELPGCNANPASDELQGDYYMGSQAHEKDGNYYYWGRREVHPNEELYIDIWRKLADPAGLFPTTQYYKRKGFTLRFLDPYEAQDMKEGAENFIKRLEQNSRYAPRHTGPSVLFRYFYQAGFDWLGAELMYGPHEVILAALRGAALSYGKNNYGSHIAIQWSTTPHDTLQKYRRYFLSLYTCYVQGVSHINTEEGLWRLEEGYAGYERFDTPCIKLREIHQKFYRYIRSHSRRGQLHAPVAFVQGKYDGWSCFGRKNVWMQEGEEWKFSQPERSWDLLNVFYPLSQIDSIYHHPCPNEPVGFFTGTPYGSTDIVPIESEEENLSRYKCLIFLGWNSADVIQAEKLLHYVQKGGTLLIGLPHLYTEIKRSNAFGKSPELVETEQLSKLLGLKIMGFQKAIAENGTRVQAGKITLGGAEVIIKDPEGVPLVLENRVGKGKAVFVNVKAYPSEQSVRSLYERLLHQAGREAVDSEKETGWLKCSDTVSFTAYDIKDVPGINRIIYFMNVNWWDEQDGCADAELLWGDRQFPLEVKRDMLHTLVLSDNWAVWIHDFETEVLELAEKGNEVLITLQGAGETEVTLINRKKAVTKTAELRMNGVKTICISEKE